jgi:hypothetical protein
VPFDVTTWFPAAMDAGRKAEIAAIEGYQDNPHLAAAVAWEEYAATQEVEYGAASVVSVSTGAQSVQYGASGPGSAALARANWHRARAKVESVPLGPDHIRQPVGYRVWLDDEGIIEEYDGDTEHVTLWG